MKWNTRSLVQIALARKSAQLLIKYTTAAAATTIAIRIRSQYSIFYIYKGVKDFNKGDFIKIQLYIYVIDPGRVVDDSINWSK